MGTLDEVKKWMTFFGWTDGGAPGSVKRDAGGRQVTAHGTSEWIKDMEDACERVERTAILAEIERRDRAALSASDKTKESPDVTS
jgi:hypothetical protein